MRRLGEYELLKKIGSGGMAEVWMGRRAAMAGASKVVAIKLLARDVLDDPDYRQMFLDEARLSMLLTNSNVVQVFDVGEIGEECFMVMEWVDGLNLSELWRKMGRGGERLSVVAAAHVIGEVLRALAYAHGLQHEGSKVTIVHRDVSPQNVLVSVSGEVKLADFGVARLAEEETSGMHVKGKLRYMAPEQLRGQSRDPGVDLYAVGAILHELLSGERFRSTRDERDLYSIVLNGVYTPLSSDLPQELVSLTARLLEPDPERRLASADHALELLYAWPGYRNSSRALARLVQKWSGVSGPRSGFLTSELVAAAQASSAPTPSASASAVNSAAKTTPVDTRLQAGEPEEAGERTALDPVTELSEPTTLEPATESADSEPTALDSVALGEAADMTPVSKTETRTAIELAPADEPTTLIGAERQPEARSNLSAMLIGAAGALLFAFGVFGIGFPLGWWGVKESTIVDGSTSSTTSTTDVAVVVETVEESDEGESEPKRDLPSPDLSEVFVELESESEGESESETGSESESGEGGDTADDGGGIKKIKKTEKTENVEKTEKAKPASVKFVLGDFDFVYVKVGRKELPLEPTASMSLAPGKHAVKIRGGPDDSWVLAGRIEVKSGKSYMVRMRTPASLELIEL